MRPIIKDTQEQERHCEGMLSQLAIPEVSEATGHGSPKKGEVDR